MRRLWLAFPLLALWRVHFPRAFTELRLRRRDCYAGALLFSQQASAEEGSDLSQFIRFVEQDQIGWQIKLPKDWITIRKEAAPKGSEGGAKSLLFSGGPTQKSEIKVLRASVGSSKSNTLDFFLSKAPTMTKEEAAEALSKSYEKKPSTFRFKLLKSKVVDRSSGRILRRVSAPDSPRIASYSFKNYCYSFHLFDKVLSSPRSKTLRKVKSSGVSRCLESSLRYGFSVARCEGAQAEIEGQRACVKPGTEDKLEAIARHWEVATTVTSTDGHEPYALWIVECSVPSESWKEEAPQIKEIVDSFGVGTKAQLDELT
ncbi:unnamed protein product [Durusdinium trenchii]|uniref:Uncharacterized protein n=1 Tax=Durusdinium trenchii TaxID=1381693 RepID=A0ABP0HLJ9_9DINO